MLREADGPTEARGPKASNAWWVERCSPRGAPQEPDGESREEPEEHKRVLITKKRQIPKFSSWEMTQQNFVNKVKDQVRKRQKRMSNVADSGEEHSIIWGCLWLRR